MVIAASETNAKSGLDRLSSLTAVAKVLGVNEVDVAKLLEEKRLAGALILALAKKGVYVTPNIKNSVQKIVDSLTPKRTDSTTGEATRNAVSAESTVTIMFTDIVDSTAMTERLGDQRAREVHRTHDNIVKSQVAVHGGRVIKSTGDGSMLSFPSARGGVSCAIEVQRELEEYNRLHPDNQLLVRIGLSVGEPIHEEEDLFGKAVIMAARVSAKASGGQVFVSEIVHALVASAGAFSFKSAGSFELKGFNGLQPIYEVLWR